MGSKCLVGFKFGNFTGNVQGQTNNLLLLKSINYIFWHVIHKEVNHYFSNHFKSNLFFLFQIRGSTHSFRPHGFLGRGSRSHKRILSEISDRSPVFKLHCAFPGGYICHDLWADRFHGVSPGSPSRDGLSETTYALLFGIAPFIE